MLAAMILALAAAPAANCAPAEVAAAINAALAARKGRDGDAAAAAIAPAAACPVTSGQAYSAHVLAAELAADRADWPAVRRLLAGIDMHPEMTLGARVRFLLMRADQGLGDAAAFTADRALTVVANDAKLSAAGRKLETFRVPAGEVSAYRAEFDQGGFHRVYQFIAVPDDPAAYPASVMLTDDQSTAAMMKQMGLGGGAAHAWFLDLYRCSNHATLAPPAAPDGKEPDYALVKARVVAALSAPDAFAATPPQRGLCASANWLAPGFGLRK